MDVSALAFMCPGFLKLLQMEQLKDKFLPTIASRVHSWHSNKRYNRQCNFVFWLSVWALKTEWHPQSCNGLILQNTSSFGSITKLNTSSYLWSASSCRVLDWLSWLSRSVICSMVTKGHQGSPGVIRGPRVIRGYHGSPRVTHMGRNVWPRCGIGDMGNGGCWEEGVHVHVDTDRQSRKKLPVKGESMQDWQCKNCQVYSRVIQKDIKRAQRSGCDIWNMQER